MARISTFTLALGAACLFSVPAMANGRFPSADQLVIDPGDPDHWLLRATFGLLQTHDAGRTFAWICEDAVGYAMDRDPALAILGDGNVLAGFSRSLRASHDDACAWTSPFQDIAQESLLDATADPADTSGALFLSHSLSTSHQVQIYVARDDGSALEPLPLALGDDFSPVTLEVAPSAANRIYVSGILNDLSTVLLRSDDRGASWQRLPIEPYGTLPAYIAAVDPVDPDRLYLRLDGETTDYLLVSDDAGSSFSEAFSFDADMLGFALSPDGSRVAVGGPEAGLFLADTDSFTFAKSASDLASVSCLKWTEKQGLLACALESVDGFTVASSEDGQSFTPLFHLQDLQPLACGAQSTVGLQCPSVWPAVAKTLGIDPGISTDPHAATSTTARGGGCAIAPASNAASWAVVGLLAGALGQRRRRQRGRTGSRP